jgi:hypothetical protein
MKGPVIAWMTLSVLLWIAGNVLREFEPGSSFAIPLSLLGWTSFLLALGYACTPSGPYGKVAFAGVVVMVAGILMKTLHLDYANASIITGLFVLITSYLLKWMLRSDRH